MKKIANYFILFMIFVTIIGGAYSVVADNRNKNIKQQKELLLHEIDIIYNSLIKEIDMQLDKKSKMSSVVILDLCIKHNFDISLLLSQAKVESCYGTKGRSLKTKSVFGVGAYDNGVNRYHYKHVNDSIEPYIILVKNDYLRNKSIDELLNHYVNYKGERYASNKRYEKIVTKVRNRILSTTDIYNLQNELIKKMEELHGIN